ncbi:MAG: tyrosine-type recombinase/integrase [Rhizomicrobium sp.]
MRPVGHIRSRCSDTWEVRYSLGRDPATGKRRVATTTVHGKRRDAERELRRLLRTLDLGEHVDPTRMTTSQWLDRWLDAMRDSVSPKTHERYSEIVANFLSPELGALPITKLAPAHIQAAYAKWATSGRLDGKEGGLSALTRRHFHRVLRSALGRAVEQQVIARNPTDAFRKRLPKVERRPMVTLSTEQSNRLLDAIRHTRLYWPCMVALATGMRRGEILALRWKNVDLERAVVRVTESLEQTKAGLRFKAPKTDRFRSVTLPRYAVADLRRLKRTQAERLLAIGVRQTGDTLLCAREDGEPHQPRSLTHEFTRALARVTDLPRVRFHDLRHSHATQLLLAGVHPKVAQERLGHSSVTVTLDVYSHVTTTMQEDAADRLDEAFQRATNRSNRMD